MDYVPKWRTISQGLNLFGICNNKNWNAFKNEVVFKSLMNIKIPQNGYIFNMIEISSEIRCKYTTKVSYDSKIREETGNTVEYYDS